MQRAPKAAPATTSDERSFVEGAIAFFRESSEFFGASGNRRAALDEARFERVIKSWHVMVVDGERIITKQLNGDPALTQNLRTAYIAAIHVLVARAARDFGKTENELLRENSGRIPVWAQIPTAQQSQPPPGLVVTVEQAATQASPAHTEEVHFTVVFSGPVTDFTAADVTLSGTAEPARANVVGGSTTYDVEVSGMTKDGTVMLSLAAGVAHDALGHPSAASTATDNTITYDAVEWYAGRIEWAMAIYETNRGQNQPRPRRSTLDTVPHVAASVAAELQQTLPHLVITLRRHPELRRLAHPPLTAAELTQADTAANAASALYQAVESSTGDAAAFTAANKRLITDAGFTAGEVATMIAGRQMHAQVRADNRLLPLIIAAGHVPPDDFVKRNALLIGQSGLTEVQVRQLLAAVARPAAIAALLRAISAAHNGHMTVDAFVQHHRAEITAAGVTEQVARGIFANAVQGQRLQQQAAAAASREGVLKSMAKEVSNPVNLAEGSLRSYIQTPANWGENSQAWQAYAIGKLSGDIGRRLTEAGEVDGGHAVSMADVRDWLIPLLAQHPWPTIEQIVRRVARRNNAGSSYPAHVWAEYQRLFPDPHPPAAPAPATHP